MGPLGGFQEAWLSLMSSIFDMGAYPAVAVLYLGRIWPQATQGNNGVMIAASILLACLLWNLFGARAVGDGSILLGALLMSPFLVITVFAIVHPFRTPISFARATAPAGE